ncbi:MAG: hypothetical protein ACXWQO_03360 [Bdellovibrionota bacterium]
MQAPILFSAKSANHQRFIELAAHYCELLQREGIPAVAWHNPELVHFNSLDGLKQSILLKSLESQINIVSAAIANHISLMDSWSLIWAFLKEMNFTPSPDIANHLAPDDYIAVYGSQMMIFLTPNHLQLMTYSLEDLYCRSWIELFRRDERIERVLMERAVSFFQGNRTQTLSNEDIPTHLLAETLSPGFRVATCRSKVYSPLFQNGVPVAFMSVNQAATTTSRIIPRPEAIY